MTLTIRPGVRLRPGVTVVKPLPPVSYSVTSVASNINEGSSLTFNVSTTAVPNGTTLYWETGDNFNGVVGGRFSPSHYGTVTINSNAASFTITISADNTTATSNPQLYDLRLYSGNYGAFGGTLVDSLEITVNDTSQTPPTHGSAVFNQPENDYMSLPALPDWNLGTTWTIEFWIYMNYGTNDNTHIQGGIWGLLNQTGWGATNSINIGLASGYLQVAGISSSAQYRAFIEPTPQQWVHVAIVNNAGTQSVYYDGVQQVQVNGDYGDGNYSNSTSPLYIGSLNSGNSFDGKLTNLRITDTAVYTANFNPPTVLPTRITNHTRLLWTPTDAALSTDTSDDPHTITNTGVTYSSSYPATNNTVGSALFNGSTLRHYKVAGGSHFQLGTTWTIEWWQKSVDNTTVLNGKLYAVMGQTPDGGRIDIYYQDGSLKVQNGQALCAEPPAGQWVHVALVNNAGSGTVYYNGVAQGATGNFGNYGQALDLYIGKRGNITYQPFNGKLTNIRITDTAVYTSNFVPSLTPTLIAGNTKLLLIPNADTINGVDTGDLALAVSSSGIRYSSEYPTKLTNLQSIGYGGRLSTFSPLPAVQNGWTIIGTVSGSIVWTSTVTNPSYYGNIEAADNWPNLTDSPAGTVRYTFIG